MTLEVKKQNAFPEKIWVISAGGRSDFNAGLIDDGEITGPVTEYRISALARYLLNPGPIEVSKKLIGYELHKHRTLLNQFKEKLKWLLPAKFRGGLTQKPTGSEIFVSETETKNFPLKDKNLDSYLQKVQDLLRPYNPVLEKLSKLDPILLADVTGICVGLDGNRSLLNIQGTISDKLQYLERLLLKDISVILEQAYISDGLFELEGYDFSRFDPAESHRLIKFLNNGTYAACVLDCGGRAEFWIHDLALIDYMFLLEQSLKTNPNLIDLFRLCIEGRATPLRLFFNNGLLINYSEAPLPKIYQKIFKSHNMGTVAHKMVVDSLNRLQHGIALNYIPHSDLDKERIFTDISVMHDFKALKSIQEHLPRLYTEIDKRTSVSEAGKFYLLDCVKGYRNG